MLVSDAEAANILSERSEGTSAQNGVLDNPRLSTYRDSLPSRSATRKHVISLALCSSSTRYATNSYSQKRTEQEGRILLAIQAI